MLVTRSRTDWDRNDYTKTDDGKRTIVLDDDTLAILAAWKKRQSQVGIHDFDFSYDGLPMIKSTIGRIIERYANFAGVHKIQAKGLRHSHASFLIKPRNHTKALFTYVVGCR